eukprot:16149396-Heterocapsa_arctica.AAC.1
MRGAPMRAEAPGARGRRPGFPRSLTPNPALFYICFKSASKVVQKWSNNVPTVMHKWTNSDPTVIQK